MKHGRALCLALAILFAALCAGCGGGQLMSDLDTLARMDWGGVLDKALDNGGRAAEPERVPALPEPEIEDEDARSAFAEEGDVYRGEDGSVLLVRPDGTCAYMVPAEPYGGEKNGEIVFEGTMADGVIRFARVSYFGIDITALAQQAGLDSARWEADAAALYAPAG